MAIVLTDYITDLNTICTDHEMIKFTKALTLNDILYNCIIKHKEFTSEDTNILLEFRTEARKIHQYMLNDRFNSDKIQNTDKELKKIKNNPTVMKYLRSAVDFDVDQISAKAPNALDITKMFKTLEHYFMISGKEQRPNRYGIEDLDLSYYKGPSEKLFANVDILITRGKSLNDVELKRKLFSFILSEIVIYRHHKHRKLKYNVATITDEYTGNRSINDLLENEYSDENVRSFLRQFDLKKIIDQKLLNANIYQTNSSGSSGKQSELSIFNDLVALVRDNKLYTAVKNMLTNFDNGAKVIEFADELYNTITTKDPSILTKEDIFHSRLVTFTANGAKTRIIAVIDWLSQSALLPLHNTIFQLLRHIPADRTFRHKEGVDIVNNKSDFYCSIDLTAATDRMPKQLQKRIIKVLFEELGLNGVDISEQWDIITDREFSVAGSNLQNDKYTTIQYKVGQAMGMLGSFAIMSLMHHFILNKICEADFDNYRIVGDDLVFSENRIFSSYYKHLKAIGIQLNENKSIICENKEDIAIEFARTFVFNSLRLYPINFGKCIEYTKGLNTASDLIFPIKELVDTSFSEEIYNSGIFRDATEGEILIFTLAASTPILNSLGNHFDYATAKKYFEGNTNRKYIPESVHADIVDDITIHQSRVKKSSVIKNIGKDNLLIEMTVQLRTKKHLHILEAQKYIWGEMMKVEGILGEIAFDKYTQICLDTQFPEQDFISFSPLLNNQKKMDIILTYNYLNQDNKISPSKIKI